MTLIIPTAIAIICNAVVIYSLGRPNAMNIYPDWLVLVALAAVNIGCGAFAHASF
jgi:hypothetical protein